MPRIDIGTTLAAAVPAVLLTVSTTAIVSRPLMSRVRRQTTRNLIDSGLAALYARFQRGTRLHDRRRDWRKMRRRITLASATLSAVALIALAAVPASAGVPDGQGLGIFGVFDCADTLGEIEVFGAPAVAAANAYLIDTEGTGPHVVLTRFEARSAAGDVLFAKNFGAKAGLTTFDCMQTGDLGDIFTLTVAIVPAR